jgi:hypothetical protein
MSDRSAPEHSRDLDLERRALQALLEPMGRPGWEFLTSYAQTIEIPSFEDVRSASFYIAGSQDRFVVEHGVWRRKKDHDAGRGIQRATSADQKLEPTLEWRHGEVPAEAVHDVLQALTTCELPPFLESASGLDGTACSLVLGEEREITLRWRQGAPGWHRIDMVRQDLLALAARTCPLP